jgi:hypothetical protein
VGAPCRILRDILIQPCETLQAFSSVVRSTSATHFRAPRFISLRGNSAAAGQPACPIICSDPGRVNCASEIGNRPAQFSVFWDASASEWRASQRNLGDSSDPARKAIWHPDCICRAQSFQIPGRRKTEFGADVPIEGARRESDNSKGRAISGGRDWPLCKGAAHRSGPLLLVLRSLGSCSRLLRRPG